MLLCRQDPAQTDIFFPFVIPLLFVCVNNGKDWRLWTDIGNLRVCFLSPSICRVGTYWIFSNKTESLQFRIISNYMSESVLEILDVFFFPRLPVFCTWASSSINRLRPDSFTLYPIPSAVSLLCVFKLEVWHPFFLGEGYRSRVPKGIQISMSTLLYAWLQNLCDIIFSIFNLFPQYVSSLTTRAQQITNSQVSLVNETMNLKSFYCINKGNKHVTTL